jgi:hypothetical protein
MEIALNIDWIIFLNDLSSNLLRKLIILFMKFNICGIDDLSRLLKKA